MSVKMGETFLPARAIWRGFFALLLLSGPAFAGPVATPAQKKYINNLYRAAIMCREYNPAPAAADDAENLRYKNACELRDKSLDRLEKQGFCFYKHDNVGWPNKKTGQCDAVHTH